MHIKNEPSTFDEIVAGWDDKVTCRWITRAGGICRRTAQWHFDIHGCQRGTICTQHYHEYLRINIHGPLGIQCPDCDRIFQSIEETYRAVRL